MKKTKNIELMKVELWGKIRYMTTNAYLEYRIQMPSEDFGAHKVELVQKDASFRDYEDIEDVVLSFEEDSVLNEFEMMYNQGKTYATKTGIQLVCIEGGKK